MAGIGGVELKPSNPCPVKPVLAADMDHVNGIPADNFIPMFANEHTQPPMLDAEEKILGKFFPEIVKLEGRYLATNFCTAF